ncbi:sensor histidine kinase [Priestia megaterium]|uniref:histidine kinase n=1 Tax=Priestia megaterium TaxID=1404 RepID=A0A3D8X2U1_PRIMG|nr:sensor histidine kinase [Priestia megaterium]MDH3173945.1 sensor histidine kinase [Priestia megaterium]RDZ14731.1 sensor histidine kinase [Priestia megaterium]
MKVDTVVKKDVLLILVMIVVVPLAGELKYYPFHDTYRVSFAVPIFFFSLLLLRGVSPVIPGILVAGAIVGFRMYLDWYNYESFDFLHSLQIRCSAGVYYLVYAISFSWFKINDFHSKPWIIGIWSIIIETVSGGMELLFMYVMVHHHIVFPEFMQIFIVGIFRSFFVLCLFSMIKLYEGQLRERQISQKNDQLLVVLSNLYEESIHLKKTLQDAERITKKSYDLYEELHEADIEQLTSLNEFSQKALQIAGEVHDIKKDNQRISAGLSKVITKEEFSEYMEIESLLQIVMRSNEKYAAMLAKDIHFSYSILGEHSRYHVYLFLSLINNLVTNAVEAIEKEGTIIIDVCREEDRILLYVRDSGPGVKERHEHLIFKAGFTSKYAKDGTPSTGLGLVYVKQMTEQLGGSIQFINLSPSPGVQFAIDLPISTLMGDKD